MIERYFAFGANVHPRTLARRRVATADARPARLTGHRLVFDQPGVRWVDPAFASVRPCDGDHVWGVLYDLEPEALERLRSFEGGEYVEVGVEVEVGGRVVAAQTFVTRDARRERLPSRRYLTVIRDGARIQALPQAWIARLDAHPDVYIPVVHELWSVAFRAVDHVHRRLTSPARRR